jgi:hypothetical protein
MSSLGRTYLFDTLEDTNMQTHLYGFLRPLLLAATTLLTVVLSACCGQFGQPSCNDPHIKVSPIASGLSIDGSQFSGATPCARISIIGLPSSTGSSGSIVLGDVTCSSGAFQKFEWHYAYFNCTPLSSVNVSVIATDQSTLKAAVQPARLPWGPGCGLVNHTQCGGEGEIPCAGGICDRGPPTLHLDFQAGVEVCTMNCGHTQGYSPCIAGMDGCPTSSGPTSTLVAPQRACVTKQNGVNAFSCFDHSRISNTTDCLCMPNTQSACTTNTSVPPPPQPLSGLCVSASFKGC